MFNFREVDFSSVDSVLTYEGNTVGESRGLLVLGFRVRVVGLFVGILLGRGASVGRFDLGLRVGLEVGLGLRDGLFVGLDSFSKLIAKSLLPVLSDLHLRLELHLPEQQNASSPPALKHN